MNIQVKDEVGALDSATPVTAGRSAGGALITMSFQAGKLVVQFVTIIALARFLTPNEFGIYAMAVPIYAFSLLFQDSGIAQAIIQRDKLSRHDLNNIFALNIAICSAVVIALFLLAPFITAFYKSDSSLWLIRAFCFVTLINGLAAQPMAILTRKMSFTYLAGLDFISYAAGSAASLGAAVVFHSYWALYCAPLVTAIVNFCGSWLKANWLPGLPNRSVPFQSLARFGSGVFGFNILNFFARNTDTLLLGRYATAAALGAYDRANRLILFPLQQINIPLGRVFLPLLSRLLSQPNRYRKAYIEGVGAILLASQAGILWLICDSKIVVPLLLGKSWGQTVDIFALMGWAALWQPFTYTAGWLFVSQNRTSAFWKWGVANALISMVSFIIAIPFGVMGFAIAYAVRENAVRLPGLIWLMGRRGTVSIRQLLVGFSPFPVACLLTVGALNLRHVVQLPGNIIVLGLDLVVAYVAYIAGLAILPRGREFLRFGFNTFRDVIVNRGK